jgi:TolB-like protein
VVDAVRCAIEVQAGLVERNAGVPPERPIEFRVGIHVGDVVEESDGDLMGDGVNIAARLQAVAKPGAICLSEQAYWQVKGRLDLKVSDLGATQLKNIAEPIRVYSLEVGVPGAAGSARRNRSVRAAAASPRRVSLLWPAVVAALAAAIAAAGAYAWHVGLAPRLLGMSVAEDKLANAPRMSIVVLPFENLSGDPGQDYFVDGITDDLTTDLSRMPDSFVLARNTALTYKGKAVDAKEVGRELGVRYALEGSVRRDGETVEVNAQLISTETGAHVWADRFEGERGKLGELRGESVSRLTNSVGLELVKAEALRAERERPKNPDALDLAFPGWASMNGDTIGRTWTRPSPLSRRRCVSTRDSRGRKSDWRRGSPTSITWSGVMRESISGASTLRCAARYRQRPAAPGRIWRKQSRGLWEGEDSTTRFPRRTPQSKSIEISLKRMRFAA